MVIGNSFVAGFYFNNNFFETNKICKKAVFTFTSFIINLQFGFSYLWKIGIDKPNSIASL